MSSLPARYESFLISNSSTIATIESSLRSLTWLLPGRFKDAEIVGEALNSTLNLLSLYHDTLLARRLMLVKSSNPKAARELIPPSVHTRYTRAWCEKDGLYKWSARSLEVVRFLQLVVEMLLARFSTRNGRWRGIFLLEFTKAFLQLVLLQRTKRPVISPPIPERDVDPAMLPALGDLPSTAPDSPPLKAKPIRQDTGSSEEGSRQTTRPSHLANNHVPFTGSSEDYLLPKALTSTLVKSPTSLLQPLAGLGQWTSEIAYILRPLIYVLLLRPTSKNMPKSKSTSINYNTGPITNGLRTPLAVSLMLSVLSFYLRRSPPASPSSSNLLERQEYARRDRDLLWYAFRGELWTEWTRPKIDGMRQRLEGKPLLGLLSGLIQDWLPLVDEYWYYMGP